MKQLKILLLLIGLTYPGIARSDLIMTDFLYHQYRFTNVDKYPEIALIQVVFSERKDRKLEMVSEIKSDQLYKRWYPYPIYHYQYGSKSVEKIHFFLLFLTSIRMRA